MSATVPDEPSDESVAQWIRRQRWYSSQDTETGSDPGLVSGSVSVSVGETQVLESGRVGIALITDDRDETYQLIRPVPGARGGSRRAAATDRAWPPVDVATDPDSTKALARLCVDEGSVDGPTGTIRGHWVTGAAPPGRRLPRPLGVDQSNTSSAVGGTHVLKVLRRLSTGIHPEVEVGLHLHHQATAGHPVAPVAPLCGWYELTDTAGGVTTLGVIHRLIPAALDGWGLVLSGLAADPGGLLATIYRLGTDVAHLHAALAQPGTTPDFGVTTYRSEAITTTISSVVDALAALEPTVGHHLVARTDRVLADLAAALGDRVLGPEFRVHGDLHLGQTVLGSDGWVILDFEGEPDRPLVERRHRQPGLRDMAGLLRSLSYASETVRRAGGCRVGPGWEPAARAALLDGYLSQLPRDLLPEGAGTTALLLALFEVKKAVYEIGYELSHRADWVDLPVTGLGQVLDRLERTGVSHP